MNKAIKILGVGACAAVVAVLLHAYYPWWVVLLVPPCATIGSFWLGLESKR
jgi:hypothetical protein